MSNDMYEAILKLSSPELSDLLSSVEISLPEILDSQHCTLLHFCVINSKPEHMRILLHHSQPYPKPIYTAWIDRPNKDGLSALLLSVSKGNSDCAKLLTQFGANIYARTPLGLDAVHLCAQGNNAELLTFFHDLRCDLQNTDNKGGTPLHWAAYMGSFNVLSLLLALGTARNARDLEGRTPLHLAVMAANEKNVRKLIVYGANTEIEDRKMRTPLKIAVEADSKNIVNMLRELSFLEKVSCKSKTKKPVRNSRYLIALSGFLAFSFVFVIFFCAKCIL
jgi:palmitoyltransferase ZDHHC13/17